MTRETGYYWVKNGASWEVAHYIGNEKWRLNGNRAADSHSSDIFSEINETRIKNPNEQEAISKFVPNYENGFTMSFLESPLLNDGKSILLLSTNDYKKQLEIQK